MFGGSQGNVFAPNKFGSNSQGGGAGTSQDVVNQIVNTVKQDMESWEKSGQWVFSCYSCAKDCPSIPGLTDFSPEELRYEAYENVKAGSTNYQTKVAQLKQEYMSKRNLLLTPDQQLKQVLVKIYNKEPIGDYSLGSGPASIFSSPTQSSQGLFGGSSSSPAPGLFGSPSKSLFGGNSTSQTGAFGSAPPTGGAGIFGGGGNSGGLFGGGSTGGSTGGSIFGGGSTTSGSAGGLFGGSSGQSGGGIFGGGGSSSGVGGIFGGSGGSSSAFGATAPAGGIFSSNPVQPSSGIFSQPPNPTFGQPAASAFGQPPPAFGQPAASTFGQPTAPAFGQTASSTFGQPVSSTFGQPGSSTFGQPASSTFGQPSDSTFGQPAVSSSTQPSSTFGTSSPFSQPPQDGGTMFLQPSSGGDIFSDPTSSIGQPTQPSGLFGKSLIGELDPSCVYSTLQELTEQDIQAYSSSSFQLGQIPINPPAQEMCAPVSS
ncbi:nucleoporin-like protein 2 [Eurytemora carolleeae]|uniref:nucleoporin-like protein 2 n=1 Tax=Eurytemora carolleeae TaxID=1294199 RepID=UPI000C78D9B8|nr:nucleoporin-like protein 2 [Eurytemora carolleeae]XP_023327532.1 nucleoporin-like protein 2 [Eurytemora carolleeae]XP_023327534.1 nucleoporin-like protein 2 [Eurytemora carolleeae]XP_023327535.1 nucleoporin-like protein 2 [Eurytemora carolleeae]XP_023327536.1 nucleoporin-like protein 2 [Eurytemora carolleeae]XP_023327537.1 nucleoporin-like protein 2 [Eurytemora carolleeae]XP_023327538.1 nucleoporin-like protein 2 [Eurytemora carolleeae]XP_023327539.1 nucleoporin-like protein 2 [Eurytemora|eukprot:XP_023327531.1 nucleoporin-like protein 2 [Eurytemora affinis]